MTIIIDRTVWVLREDYDALKAENERLAVRVADLEASRAQDDREYQILKAENEELRDALALIELQRVSTSWELCNLARAALEANS